MRVPAEPGWRLHRGLAAAALVVVVGYATAGLASLACLGSSLPPAVLAHSAGYFLRWLVLPLALAASAHVASASWVLRGGTWTTDRVATVHLGFALAEVSMLLAALLAGG